MCGVKYSLSVKIQRILNYNKQGTNIEENVIEVPIICHYSIPFIGVKVKWFIITLLLIYTRSLKTRSIN